MTKYDLKFGYGKSLFKGEVLSSSGSLLVDEEDEKYLWKILLSGPFAIQYTDFFTNSNILIATRANCI